MDRVITKAITQQPSRISRAGRIIDFHVPPAYITVKMIKRFQLAVSYLYYYIGDLTSRTPWFKLYGLGWRVYQFCMQESVKLDIDYKIWKAVEPKAVTKARRRKRLRGRSRRVD